MLGDYLERMLAGNGVSVAEYGAACYHETGVPVSVTLAQQNLIKCSEVLDVNACYYIIPVPLVLEPKVEVILVDPDAGANQLLVTSLGRKLPVRVDFGKTTMLELKQKLCQLVKVPTESNGVGACEQTGGAFGRRSATRFDGGCECDGKWSSATGSRT